MRIGMSALLLVLPLMFPLQAAAAEMTDEQSALWSFVAQSWVDDSAESGEWPDAYVRDDVVSWGAEWPVPRGKASMGKWTKFRDANSDTLAYELFPHEVLVVGDTGVVFYSVVRVGRDADGEPERSVEGVVETAVRTDGVWKYLALTGFGTDVESDD
ncbi:MAG: hypothetical protein RIC56_15080 [Pseudomonadales bacterium]